MRAFNVEVRDFALLLAGLDIIGVISASETVSNIVSDNTKLSHNSFYLNCVILVACISGPTFLMGLYQRAFLTFRKLTVRTVVSFSISILLIYLIFSEFTFEHPARRIIIIIAFVSFTSAFIIRLILCRVAQVGHFKHRILVLGNDLTGRAVEELERKVPHAGFSFLGTLRPDFQYNTENNYWPQRIIDACRKMRPHEIIVSGDVSPDDACWAELLTCHLRGTKITSFADFIERETRRIELNEFNVLQMIVSRGIRRGPASILIKRMLDVSVSVVLLLLFFPLLVLAALAIWAEDRGPVLYRQDRVGLGGKTFQIFKFRSMRCDAEADGRARWASRGDPRITRVGLFLRRSRIDEIPQLINVLRGEMSLVGPRPERPTIVESLQFTIPYYSYRSVVRPGITGWAQINYPYGQSFEDAVEKTKYDLFYIKNGSNILDLAILLQTIRVILMYEGL